MRKHKLGDLVRIKSLEWYRDNCDQYGNIWTTKHNCFGSDMKYLCGHTFRIDMVNPRRQSYRFTSQYANGMEFHCWVDDDMLEDNLTTEIDPYTGEEIC